MKSNHIRTHLFSNNALILGMAVTLLLSACYLNMQTKRPIIILSKQETAININTKFLQILSAGHKRLITDMLWIQTLMESDTDHYKKRDLNNWLFLRFNTISILDPKLYQNYLYGGQFLNIVKDDLEGAKLLYDKGLHYFPNDYDLNFQTGFLYYFEIGDSKNGLKYLSRVEQHPKAPLFLRSITNKLRFEVGGDREEIFKLVLINYQITKDPMLKARLKNDLYSIRAEIDLICLNSQGKNCHTRDIDGSPYLLEGGIYKTSKPFKPYRIKSRIKK